MKNQITLNGKSNRQYLIWKLQRDWPALRYDRNLTKLSMKQLQAKMRHFERMQSQARHEFILWQDSLGVAR